MADFEKIWKGIKFTRDAAYLYNISKDWRDQWIEFRKRNDYHIVLKQSDFSYEKFVLWLADRAPDVRRFEAEWGNPVKFKYNESGRTKVVIDGHTVEVVIGDGEDQTRPETVETYRTHSPRQLTITARTKEGAEAVKNLLQSLVPKEDRPLFLNVLGNWGEWKKNVMPPRPIESVILPDGKKELLLEDLQRFLDSEGVYAHWGQPWHRGYLIYGVPGTGKSSMIKAIASYFERDVYFLNVGSIKNDNALQEAIGEVDSKSILVLEDVDCVSASRDRSDYEPEDGGVTLQGLLNVLDGLMTPHGLVTIMTTNHKDRLDPALIRPGRADVHIELGYLTDEQFARMCERFFERRVEMPSVENLQITPSEVVETFKNNFHHIDGAEVELKQLITDRGGSND